MSDKLKYEELAHKIKVLEKENSDLHNKLEFHELFNEYTNHWETFRDSKGKLIYVSSAFENITGYSKESYLNGQISFIDLIHPEDLSSAKQYFQKQMEGKAFSDFICRLYDKNNSLKFLTISSTPLFNHKNEYLGFRTSCIDITKIKHLELLQKENEEKSNELNHLSSEMLGFNDLNSIYDFIANSLQKRYSNTIILYNSIDEENEDSKLEYVAGLDGSHLMKVLNVIGFNPIGKRYKLVPTHNDYFRSGKFVEFKGGLNKFSASEIPRLAAKAIETLIGLHKIYTIGIKKDEHLLASIHFFTFNKKEINDSSFIESFVNQSGIILQKKMAEIELQKSQEKLSAIVNLSPVIISIVDKSGTIKYNSAFENNLLGYNKVNRTGSNVFKGEFVHPDDIATYKETFEKILQNSDQIYTHEYRGLTTERGYVWFEATIKNYIENPAISGILIVMQEITNRKKAEQALKESQEKFKQVLKNSSDIFILLDSVGTSLFVSDSSEKILGYKAEELTNLSTMDQMFHPEDKEKALLALKEFIENGYGITEYRFKHKKGHWVYLETTGSNQLNNPSIRAIVVNIREITGRKLAEENLRKIEEKARKNNELLRSILESPKGIIIFSLDLKYCYSAFTVSHKETMKLIWNIDIEIGMNMLDVINNPSDKAKAKLNFERALKGEHFILIEEYGDNGHYRTSWENRYSPIYDDKKRIVGLTVFVTDITERILVENALHKSVEKNQAIMNANPDMIFHFTNKGVIMSYHASSNSDLYIPPDQFIGRNLNDVLPPQISEPVMESMKLLMEAQKMVTFEYELLIQNEKRYYECRIIALSNDEALSFVRDITERKLAEENLLKLNNQLHDLNSTKDKLFSIIAHDLRSPFNSILGLSGLLNKNIQNYPLERLRQISESINNASKSSMNLLENLLEWAKTQTGQMNFTPEKSELIIIVQEVINVLNSAASIKNISLNYFQSENIIVTADLFMLNTILRNLISNAIKYTNSDGKINIYAINDISGTEITVADNGIGMSDEIKKNLFMIDQKIIFPGTANEKGSGLGLILCKEFIEIHGGKIWVESIEGKGSTFKFTMPYR